jgi:hypothetical protein
MIAVASQTRGRNAGRAPLLATMPALAAALVLMANAPAHGAQPAPYVGRWYVSTPVVCTGAPDETDGLLTYTAREFIGLENRCRIVRAHTRAGATELAMRCLGEGHPYRTREIVTVVDGHLHRRVRVDGNWETYTYERCPTPAK